MAVFGQSALQQQNERDLQRADQMISAVFADTTAPQSAKAAMLKNKGIVLGKLARTSEALPYFLEASKMAPDDFSIPMQAGIVLELSGDHESAREVFEALIDRISVWQTGKIAMQRAGQTQDPYANDQGNTSVALELPIYAANNSVFLNKDARALTLYNNIYDVRVNTFGPDAYTDYAVMWRIWLTGKTRAAAGLRDDGTIVNLIKSLRVTSAYHGTMLIYFQDRATWDNVLTAIDAMGVSPAEKENLRTEAHFFAAGYLRYVKRNDAAALALLQAENARPYNGCVERLFIQKEIQSLTATAAR